MLIVEIAKIKVFIVNVKTVTEIETKLLLYINILKVSWKLPVFVTFAELCWSTITHKTANKRGRVRRDILRTLDLSEKYINNKDKTVWKLRRLLSLTHKILMKTLT